MGKKRRLPLGKEAYSSIQQHRIGHVEFVLAILLLAPTVVSQFTSCLEACARHRNQHGWLGPTDYTGLVAEISFGKVQLDMGSSIRTPIHQVFDARVDASIGAVNVSPEATTAALQLEYLCDNLYQSFFLLFEDYIHAEICESSIAMYGITSESSSQPPSTTIHAADLVYLMAALIGESDESNLSKHMGVATWQVYTDYGASLAGGKEKSLVLSQSPSQLQRFFCRRLVLGIQLDDPSVAIRHIPGTNGKSIFARSPLDSQNGTYLAKDASFEPPLSPTVVNNPSLAPNHAKTTNLSLAQRENDAPSPWVVNETALSVAPTMFNNYSTPKPSVVNETTTGPILGDITANAAISPTPRSESIHPTHSPWAANETATFTPSTIHQTKQQPTPTGFLKLSSMSNETKFPPLSPVFVNDTLSFTPTALNNDTFTPAPTVNDQSTSSPSPINSPFPASLTTNQTGVPSLAPVNDTFTWVPTLATTASSAAPLSTRTWISPEKHLQKMPIQQPFPGESQTVIPSHLTDKNSSPTLFPSTGPTISPQRFSACQFSLMVSDHNKDNMLGTDEYTNFLFQQFGDDFKDKSFDALDSSFRLLYLMLREKGSEYPSVAGSKLEEQMQATASQKANLQHICEETDRVYAEYKEKIHYEPTVTPSESPVLRIDVYTISRSQLGQCKVLMLVSDVDKNSELTQDEFVGFINRLTGNTFRGTAYSQLPAAFRLVFGTSSSPSGFVSTVGSRTSEQATPEQLGELEKFCEAVYSAVANWKETGDISPTGAPLFPSTQSPVMGLSTTAPTLNRLDFLFCTTSLAANDRDQNNYLDQQEYVGFLNRLTSNLYFGLSFPNIDLALQINFSTLQAASLIGPSESIHIAGARPGKARTPDENAWLMRICSETERSLSMLGTSPPSLPPLAIPSLSPIAPSTPATPNPTPGPAMSPLQFARCRAFLSISDTDQNKALASAEYIDFLNKLSGNSFAELDYLDLDILFRELFIFSQSSNGMVSIIGARSQDSPTPEQSAALFAFCGGIYQTLDEYNNRPAPTPAPVQGDPLNPFVLQCIQDLAEIDIDADQRLDRNEYIVFLNQFSNKTVTDVTSFDSLPYILRDNFDWIAEGNSSIYIDGIENATELSRTRLAQLSRLCRRTDKVVSSSLLGNNETDLTKHCFGSFTAADEDTDNLISMMEYTVLVDYFQGFDKVTKGYEYLDEPFRTVFETNKGSSAAMLNIEGSKPWQDVNVAQEFAWQYLCGALVEAVDAARLNYILLTKCSDALVQVNEDEDDRLTQEEYVDFVYELAGKNRGNSTYMDLPSIFWLNFERLKDQGSETISIIGWRVEQVSSQDRDNLKAVCSASVDAVRIAFPTDPSVPEPTIAPTPLSSSTKEPLEVRVYNGFVLGSDAGLSLSNLRIIDITTVGETYSLFVRAVILPILSGARRLRGRGLSVQGFVEGSTRVYDIVDEICPANADNATNNCLGVYASFDILVLGNESVTKKIQEEYTALTQNAIDNGELQAKLEVVSPNQRFMVIGATMPILPDFSPSTAFPVATLAPTAQPDKKTDSDDSGGGLPKSLIFIGVAAMMVCCAFAALMFHCSRRKRRQKTVNDFFGQEEDGLPQDKKDTKKIANDGDDEGNPLSIDMSDSTDDESPQKITRGSRPSGNLLPKQSDHKYAEPGFAFSTTEHERTSVPLFEAEVEASPGFDNKGGWSSSDNDVNPDLGWSPKKDSTGSPRPDSIQEETNDWIGGGGSGQDVLHHLENSEDSEGSEELVDRSMPNTSMAGRSRASRQTGRMSKLSQDGQDRYFGESPSTSSHDSSGSGSSSSSTSVSLGVQESEGFATDMDLSDADGSFNESEDFATDMDMSGGNSFQNESFKGFRGGDPRTGQKSNSNKNDYNKNDDHYDDEYDDDDYGDDDYEDEYNTSGDVDFDDQEDGSEYRGSPSEGDNNHHDDHHIENETLGEETIEEDETIRSTYTRSQPSLGSGLGQQASLRAQVAALVAQVVPDEVDNVDAMMVQFRGREQDLIKTLQTMANQVAGDTKSKAEEESYAEESYRSEESEEEYEDGEEFYDEGSYQSDYDD